jgi:hypothetical protein
MSRFYTSLIFIILFIASFSLFSFIKNTQADTSGTVIMTVRISVCGNGIKEGGEDCDGTDFGGAICGSISGFNGGTLSCALSCDFNTSLCTYTAPSTPAPSGGGGGGGGGGSSVITGAIFSGRAYPKSTVTLLKDAQVAATTVAGADSNFKITLSGLSGGNYIFSVYSEDNKGIRSSLLTFPVSITSGATTNIGGIFIAPTIAVDKSEVKKGDNIAIFGQSAVASEITISVNSDEEFFVKRIADASGVYLINFDTSVLEMGQHLTKSKAALKEEISSFSKTVGFAVGTKNVAATLNAKCPAKADLNSDCKVNLVDFSIAAYWYKRSLDTTFRTTETEKLNSDGKVDLVDFSIMAYYWTG